MKFKKGCPFSTGLIRPSSLDRGGVPFENHSFFSFKVWTLVYTLENENITFWTVYLNLGVCSWWVNPFSYSHMFRILKLDKKAKYSFFSFKVWTLVYTLENENITFWTVYLNLGVCSWWVNPFSYSHMFRILKLDKKAKYYFFIKTSK